ncbi:MULTISPECIES: GTP 3',8-cyclase MoaA [unclassified Clostridium]|uniref:GTP 3',8-cyclase MoaA n=1 Tax=unclassified Clostridium TaxID=2614128 RepID=UPI00029733CC|nr:MULTISPECIES: GTP 3',8-cyclase MoaA [unclassified Clostridium]EKQ55063.1 MAG: molybdenum cofactor biosynthesis protein A [Clostridium sp. Maddingley MBC34-26]
MLDLYKRNIEYLRISITDKCNLRCKYCVSEGEFDTLKNDEILTFDEIIKICRSASNLGITKIKITGGEPLLRQDAVELIRYIKELPHIKSVTLTTNGVFLYDKIQELKSSGVDSVNVSLDTLIKEKFNDITRRSEFDIVINGIEKAIKSGIKIKINCVPIKNFNFDELSNIALISKEKDVDVRFIEMMPMGLGKSFNGISSKEILDILEKEFGKFSKVNSVKDNGPAVYYKNDIFKGRIGFISAISNEFCKDCNRIRITADGLLKPCLCYGTGIDLKNLIRNGISEDELTNVMKSGILSKPEKHEFNEDKKSNNIEIRKMSQIGG